MDLGRVPCVFDPLCSASLVVDAAFGFISGHFKVLPSDSGHLYTPFMSS